MERKTKIKLKRNAQGLLFVTPLIVYFLVFQLAPMLIALVLSFTDYDGISEEINWVGIGNYLEVMTNSMGNFDHFWHSLLVTVEYILLTVPANILIALVVSALLNSKVKGEKFFKTAFYVPSVTASVAITAMWKFMLDPQAGLINQILGTEIDFLQTEGLNLVTLAIMSVWGGIGYNVLIMLSAMKNIDRSLYEAASIEGANSFKQFWQITVPGVMPTVFFFLITGIIGGFQAFEQMYLMTGKGKNYSTFTYVYGVYEQLDPTSGGGVSMGAAMSFILFIILLGLTVIQFRSLIGPNSTGKKKGRAKR